MHGLCFSKKLWDQSIILNFTESVILVCAVTRNVQIFKIIEAHKRHLTDESIIYVDVYLR